MFKFKDLAKCFMRFRLLREGGEHAAVDKNTTAAQFGEYFISKVTASVKVESSEIAAADKCEMFADAAVVAAECKELHAVLGAALDLAAKHFSKGDMLTILNAEMTAFVDNKDQKVRFAPFVLLSIPNADVQEKLFRAIVAAHGGNGTSVTQFCNECFRAITSMPIRSSICHRSFSETQKYQNAIISIAALFTGGVDEVKRCHADEIYNGLPIALTRMGAGFTSLIFEDLKTRGQFGQFIDFILPEKPDDQFHVPLYNGDVESIVSHVFCTYGKNSQEFAAMKAFLEQAEKTAGVGSVLRARIAAALRCASAAPDIGWNVVVRSRSALPMASCYLLTAKAITIRKGRATVDGVKARGTCDFRGTDDPIPFRSFVWPEILEDMIVDGADAGITLYDVRTILENNPRIKFSFTGGLPPEFTDEVIVGLREEFGEHRIIT
jgi:hypothetical protein